MNRRMNVLTVLLLTVLVTIPAHAQQQVPKGTEVPEVRKQEGKGTEGQDLRRKVKRKAATIESQKPKGPEIRKQEGRGTEGSDVPKEQKKQ